MENEMENNINNQTVKNILDELVQKISIAEDLYGSQVNYLKDEGDRKIVDEEHDDEEEWEDANGGDETEQAKEDFEDEHEFDEEEEGDEEYDEQVEEGEEDYKKELDDDEIAENPAYIPKQGKFYMHDLDRSVPPAPRSAFDSSLSGDEDKDLETEQISAVSKHEDDEPKSRAERVLRWKHDMFDERAQGPKGRRELMHRYGCDIRRDNEAEDEGNINRNFRRTNHDQQRTREVRESGRGIRRPRGRGGIIVTNMRTSPSTFSNKKDEKIEDEQQEQKGESQHFSSSRSRIIRNSAVTPGERGRAYGLGGKNGGSAVSNSGRLASNNQQIQREGRFVRGESQQQQQYIHNQHHNSQQYYNQSSNFTPQSVRGRGRGGGRGFKQPPVQREGRFAGGESNREVRYIGGESQRGHFVREDPQRGRRFARGGNSQRGNYSSRDSHREERYSGGETKSYKYNQQQPIPQQNIAEPIRGGLGGSGGGFGGGSQRSNIFNQESNLQSHMVPPQQQYNQPSLINYQTPMRGGRGGGGGFGGGSQRGNHFQGSVPSRALLPQGMPQYRASEDNYNTNVSNALPPIPLQQSTVQHYQPQQHQVYQSPQQISIPPPTLLGQQQNYPHPRQPTEPVFFATDQQQNRMMNQFPQRERQRLHIEPPPH